MIGLTWQFVQHRLTGSVVVVELLAGALGRGGAATGPIDTFDASRFTSQGFTTPILAISGRNRGRLTADVTRWDVLTDDGFGYTLPGFGPNPQVPHRLEPGAAVTFYCPLADVAALFASKRTVGKTDERIRGSLSSGTGEFVRSKLVPMS